MPPRAPLRVTLRVLALLWMPLWASLPALAQAPAAPSAFTAEQRQEVVHILRDALRADPSILREALAALQADEARREERAARDALTALRPRLVDPADPVAGNPMGDVTVIEFYDTRCPYCRRMKPVIADLLKQDPNLRLVVKDLPILGPASQLESRALLAAQRQGGYFRLQAALMRSTAQPDRDSIRAEAERVGLDAGRLMRDLDDPAIKARLEANVALAREIGLQGTPAFIVGTKLLPGAVELGELRQAVAETRAGR